MSVENVKEYLEELRDGLECDGEWHDNTPISCRGLYFILKRFTEELEK